MPLSEDIRRVVTTVDKDGKAVVLFDGANPHKVVRPNRSVPKPGFSVLTCMDKCSFFPSGVGWP